MWLFYLIHLLYIRSTQRQQGVQELQVFAFCVVSVNNEHTKPRFKINVRG